MLAHGTYVFRNKQLARFSVAANEGSGIFFLNGGQLSRYLKHIENLYLQKEFSLRK